ncbi:hypothetical protein M9H77_09141 [Catharanthus roseus]|uniref:Uncharacterized protein n=1 Tax=Catharanthus roseus TaxID=4058 RepID=A0ACC0C067_CATRO|nr:hypothetical protein M9H77_09141 [Catharanthus roseus]
MILRRLADSLRFLQSLIDLNTPNKDQINNLKLILTTLQVFLAYIANLIDSLMENPKDVLIRSKNDLIVALKDKIKSLVEKLRFFSNFLRFKENCCIGTKVKTHSGPVAEKSAWVLNPLSVNHQQDKRSVEAPSTYT